MRRPSDRASIELGWNLQAWRKLLSLTQQQVAERALISRKTLARVESGRPVSSEHLWAVLQALNLLEPVVRASDPYETDLGRLRADEQLPQRVRPS